MVSRNRKVSAFTNESPAAIIFCNKIRKGILFLKKGILALNLFAIGYGVGGLNCGETWFSPSCLLAFCSFNEFVHL